MTAARFLRGEGEPDLLRLFERLVRDRDLELLEPLRLRLDAAEPLRLRLRFDTAEPLLRSFND